MSEEAAPRAHVRTPETDEVLRRIGRNVVIFQQVLDLLKGHHVASDAPKHLVGLWGPHVALGRSVIAQIRFLLRRAGSPTPAFRSSLSI